MRIIFLNTWYSQVGKPFWTFIKEHSRDTDIFCLQEVNPKTFEKMSGILKNHKGLLEVSGWSRQTKQKSGQAVFIKNTIKILSSKKVLIYKLNTSEKGILFYLRIKMNGQTLSVGNVHGKTYPGHKQDTPIRIRQSQKIIDFFKSTADPKIVGGDFNLMPETKSVKRIEETGFRNLIKDFRIASTRNRLSWQQFGHVQHFADYVFTSPEVHVKAFSVPDIEISDHLPLILDFEV